MASASQTAIAPGVHRIAGRNGLVDKYFYLFASLLTAAIVVAGFSRTVSQNLFHPTVPRPFMLWVHAAAFSGWVVFFIFQSTLVRTRNVKWHRFFGWFGLALGTAMVLIGLTTAVIMGRFDTHQLHEPGSDAFLLIPFYDMVAFGTCFGLAILWRRKPELHRRMIFIGTCGLLSAAFGRFGYLAEHSLFYAGVDCAIFLGVLRDLLVNRRPHRIYLFALPALILCQTFVVHTVNSNSAWWLRIAHAILG